MTDRTASSDLAADAEMLWLSQRLAAQDDERDRALARACLLELARAAAPPVARRAARILAERFGTSTPDDAGPLPLARA